MPKTTLNFTACLVD